MGLNAGFFYCFKYKYFLYLISSVLKYLSISCKQSENYYSEYKKKLKENSNTKLFWLENINDSVYFEFFFNKTVLFI